MKVTHLVFAIALAGCSSISMQAQNDVSSIAGVFEKYETDLLINTEQKPSSKKSEKQVSKLAYNPKMLNMFMANSISTYLASSKDISLQKYYAILESGDGSLFLGYNLMFRNDNISRLKHIVNVGLKTDLEDNFSAIISDNKINPKMALNLKYTGIQRGKIFFGKNHREAVEEYRNRYLKKKYEEDLKKYKDTINDNTELETKLKYASTLTGKEKKELIKEEFSAQYEKIAADEEKFITSHKMYNSVVTGWFTIESYIPLANREYKISPSPSVFTTVDEKFYNFSTNISYTRMQKWSTLKTLYSTVNVGVYNNNNILTKKLKAYKYETVTDQGGGNQTVTDSKDAYAGNYFAAISASLKGELVCFFIKDIAGISLAAEAVFGDFSARNWKIGLPVSLKDKDDKPSVNVELQFKEVFKNHYFGISAGYAFGKFFK